MALANIISVIHEGSYMPKPRPMRPFDQEKMAANERATQWLKSGASNDLYLDQPSTEWMI